MKILYICNEYPPYLYGGIGSFTRDIAESMQEAGNTVEVWGIYHDITKDYREILNGIIINRIKGLKKTGMISHFRYRIEFYFKLQSFLRNNKFDIVECQEWNGLLPFGLNHSGFVVRLHGAAIFFDKLLNRKGNFLTHFFEKMMIKHSKNLVAVSNFCGQQTLRLCEIQKKEFQTIYNAVDVEKLQGFIEPSYQKYKIVFANSVLPKKGVFELVKSFNIIAKKFPDSTLHIIGKLNYCENQINIKELLESTIDKKYADRLMIRGWLDSADDVFKELATAHVCVYPSHMEGFGIAPVEPMSMGKPVLFMKSGPGPEVLENKVSGLHIDSFCPKDIAEKIELVFNNNTLIERFQIEGPKRANLLFNKSTIFAKNNIDYYNRILK